jgi:hypothetical protein
MGPFYTRRDSVFYWVGTPVIARGRVLGYLLLRRTVLASARTERTIRDLNGSDSVSIFFASEGSPCGQACGASR